MQLLEGGDSINLEQPNSKTRRGRVGRGIANTLTCSCNQGVVIEEEIDINKSVPKLVGGIGEINFGKQWRQGNRVYDSKEVSMCLMAQPVGNAGGYSYLYKINNKKENDTYMWKNDLEKFNFKMEELQLFDSFAGKGALHKALKKLGIPVNVIGLSEIEPDAIIAYAGIHIPNFLNSEFAYPSDDEMKELLMSRNIGWDFMKEKSSILRMKKDKLKLLYKATILTNNFGDISKLDYPNLPDFDLFNFSFPCTDISNAGKQQGLKNEDGTHTRSGLVKFGIDLIKAKKPKYIMIENVKGLIQKKFINDFYDIVNEIESYGYKCHYATKEDKKGNISPKCLNAKDFGIPQNRERIFVICIRNDVDFNFEFPKGFDNGTRLKDILENNVDEKYYLSDEIQKRFKLNGKEDTNHNELNVVGSSAPPCRTIGQRDMTYGTNGIMSTLTATDYKQPKQIVDTNKVERLGGVFDKEGKTHQAGSVYNKDCLSPTITTCEGGYRQPIVKDNNIEVIGKLECQGWHDIETRVHSTDGIAPTMETRNRSKWLDDKNYKIRKLTPLECFRLMGFDDEDFDNAKELGLSDSSLYKLAGNSIVVNCLYYIFKELFKEYIISK